MDYSGSGGALDFDAVVKQNSTSLPSSSSLISSTMTTTIPTTSNSTTTLSKSNDRNGAATSTTSSNNVALPPMSTISLQRQHSIPPIVLSPNNHVPATSAAAAAAAAPTSSMMTTLQDAYAAAAHHFLVPPAHFNNINHQYSFDSNESYAGATAAAASAAASAAAVAAATKAATTTSSSWAAAATAGSVRGLALPSFNVADLATTKSSSLSSSSNNMGGAMSYAFPLQFSGQPPLPSSSLLPNHHHHNLDHHHISSSSPSSLIASSIPVDSNGIHKLRPAPPAPLLNKNNVSNATMDNNSSWLDMRLSVSAANGGAGLRESTLSVDIGDSGGGGSSDGVHRPQQTPSPLRPSTNSSGNGIVTSPGSSASNSSTLLSIADRQSTKRIKTQSSVPPVMFDVSHALAHTNVMHSVPMHSGAVASSGLPLVDSDDEEGEEVEFYNNNNDDDNNRLVSAHDTSSGVRHSLPQQSLPPSLTSITSLLQQYPLPSLPQVTSSYGNTGGVGTSKKRRKRDDDDHDDDDYDDDDDDDNDVIDDDDYGDDNDGLVRSRRSYHDSVTNYKNQVNPLQLPMKVVNPIDSASQVIPVAVKQRRRRRHNQQDYSCPRHRRWKKKCPPNCPDRTEESPYVDSFVHVPVMPLTAGQAMANFQPPMFQQTFVRPNAPPVVQWMPLASNGGVLMPPTLEFHSELRTYAKGACAHHRKWKKRCDPNCPRRLAEAKAEAKAASKETTDRLKAGSQQNDDDGDNDDDDDGDEGGDDNVTDDDANV